MCIYQQLPCFSRCCISSILWEVAYALRGLSEEDNERGITENSHNQTILTVAQKFVGRVLQCKCVTSLPSKLDALPSKRGKELLNCAPRIRLRVEKSTALHFLVAVGSSVFYFDVYSLWLLCKALRTLTGVELADPDGCSLCVSEVTRDLWPTALD